MLQKFISHTVHGIASLGHGLEFLREVFSHISRGHIRLGEVFKQVYEQGVHSVMIIALTALATGLVLALQAVEILGRFGAKEYIAPMVAWSLLREMGPVFTAIIFSAKAGARIAAELGTMNVNDQILATRTLGVDPIEFLVVPRMLACFLVLPVLTIISEVVGIAGGYLVGVFQGNIPGPYYLTQTFKAIRYVDFFSGFAKVFFFSVFVGWICCFQGFFTTGGSMGVGKYTTQAVAYSVIVILLSNTILTKLIIMLWG